MLYLSFKGLQQWYIQSSFLSYFFNFPLCSEPFFCLSHLEIGRWHRMNIFRIRLRGTTITDWSCAEVGIAAVGLQ